MRCSQQSVEWRQPRRPVIARQHPRPRRAVVDRAVQSGNDVIGKVVVVACDRDRAAMVDPFRRGHRRHDGPRHRHRLQQLVLDTARQIERGDTDGGAGQPNPSIGHLPGHEHRIAGEPPHRRGRRAADNGEACRRTGLADQRQDMLGKARYRVDIGAVIHLPGEDDQRAVIFAGIDDSGIVVRGIDTVFDRQNMAAPATGAEQRRLGFADEQGRGDGLCDVTLIAAEQPGFALQDGAHAWHGGLREAGRWRSRHRPCP